MTNRTVNTVCSTYVLYDKDSGAFTCAFHEAFTYFQNGILEIKVLYWHLLFYEWNNFTALLQNDAKNVHLRTVH